MGTRSRIGVMHGNKVKSVYCHWNGSVEHTGTVLQAHYDSAKANYLVALGDMSVLSKNIEIPPDVEHSFDAPAGDITVFYGRDRGEKNTEFRVALTFEQFLEQCDNCAAEYYYIMRDGEWYCGTTYENTHPLSRTLTALTEALTTQKEVA